MLIEFETRRFVVIINSQKELTKMINAGKPFISVPPYKVLINENIKEKIMRSDVWASLIPFNEKIEFI